MPVFLDNAGRDRDSRIESIKASALPNLGPETAISNGASSEKYDIVVAGVSVLRFSVVLKLGQYADLQIRLARLG